MGSFNWKSDLLAPVLRFTMIGGYTPSPLHLVFFQNASDRSFEMAIFCRAKLGKGSFNWKLKVLVLFLTVESDWRATSALFNSRK